MTVAGAEPNWVDLVGFQHERVHTGVLMWMLDEARDESVRCAAASTTVGRPVQAVLWAQAEAKAAGAAGISDLVFAARFREGEREVAVETKVDSLWRIGQLENAVGEDGLGVLLALGCQALALTEADLPERWHLCDLSDWLSLLTELADAGSLPRAIEDYRIAIAREHHDHHTARSLAGRGELPREELVDRRGPKLAQWAYFGAFLDEVPAAERRWWLRDARVSGPLLGLWLEEDLSSNPAAEIYLQLMGHGAGGREIAVKVSAPPARLGALRDALAQTLDAHVPGLAEPRRSAGANAKSCTVRRKQLSGLKPKQTAELVRHLEQVIADAAKDVFKAATSPT